MESTELWVARDGRRLPVAELDDAHLHNIVRMGMRSLARHYRRESLEELAAAAGGDDGLQYAAEVSSDSMLEIASSPRELLRRLAGSKRYGAVVREARTRARLVRGVEPVLAA
jgi:hypothetical protein